MVENNPTHFGAVDVANLGSGVTMGGGLSVILTENATAIGSGMIVVTGVTTIIFYILTYIANRRGQNIRRSEIERDVYNDLINRSTSAQKEVIMSLIRGD